MTSSRPRFRCKLDEAGSSFDKFPSWCWSAWEGDIYWDPWRTNSYAGNDIRFKTEVENFEVKDETGWRKINPNIELENFTLKDQPLTTSKPLLSLREEVTMRDHRIPEGSLPDVPVIRFWAEAIELGSLYVSFEKK